MIELHGRLDPVKTLQGTMNAVAGDVYDVPPVHIKPTLQAKAATPTGENQKIVPDEGYDGLSSVAIEAVLLQAKSVSATHEDQYIQPDNGYTGLSIVEVKKMQLQEKTVTENGTVSPDEGYDGLSKVTVAVESSGESSPLPIEVSTEAEMTALLKTAEVGSVYKYTGETTATYEYDALYIVSEE